MAVDPQEWLKAQQTQKVDPQEWLRSQQTAKVSQPSGVNATYNPTDGMSKFDLFAAGLGKSFYDAARGVGQVVGLVSEADIDAAKQTDKALMDTGFGTAGKVAGDVLSVLAPGGAAVKYGANIPKIGKAVAGLGRMVTAPKGVLPALGGGAVIGATQPVGTNDSRLTNTALNAGFGAAIPALATVGGAGKTMLHDIWTKKGQEALAGGVLERIAASVPDDIIRAIDGSQPIFPGYQNTLPETLAGDSGIATFAHTQASRDPFGVGTKTKLNTKSQELTNRILDTFQDQAGSPQKRQALQDEIEAATSQLYEQGRNQQIPITPDLASLFDRPVINQAAQYKRGSLANRGSDFSPDFQNMLDGGQNIYSKTDPLTLTQQPRTITGADLQGVKIGVNDLRNQEISGMTSSKLRDRIGSMDQAKADLSSFLPDELRQADAAYSELAQKQAQMNVFDALLNMQNPVLKDTGFGTIYANKMANALDNDKLAKLATGWDRTRSLGDVLTPEQMQIIDQAEKALQTQSIIAKQGAAKGSPTGQNETGRQLISGLVKNLGLPSWLPDNALAQTLVETPLSRTLFRIPEANVDRMLSDALVDPNYAKQILQQRQATTAPTSLGRMLERQFLPALGVSSYITEQ